MNEMDYTKLPWWSRNRFDSPRWRKFLCRIGLHIPVKAVDPDGIETFCQECIITLPAEAWEKFWGKARAAR